MAMQAIVRGAYRRARKACAIPGESSFQVLP